MSGDIYAIFARRYNLIQPRKRRVSIPVVTLRRAWNGGADMRGEWRNLVWLTCAAMALATCAHASDAATDCSMEVAELRSQAVIEPCSIALQRTDLSREQRGLYLFIRGRGHHRSSRFELAQKDYDQALTLIEQNDELYLARSNIAFRLGEWDDGLRLLNKALEINPRNAHAWRAVASLYGDGGQPEQALHYYSKAIELDPTEAYAWLFRARVYANLGKHALALADIDALLRIDPMSLKRQGFLSPQGDMRDFIAVALEERGEILESIGEFDRAEQDFNAAVARERSGYFLGSRARFLLARNGRAEASLADLDASIELAADNPVTHYNRAVALTTLERPDEAFAAVNSAIRINPQYARALLLRARMNRKRGDSEAATSDMIRAISNGGPSMLALTIPALQHAGYWRSPDVPTEITPELRDAVAACMLDESCN